MVINQMTISIDLSGQSDNSINNSNDIHKKKYLNNTHTGAYTRTRVHAHIVNNISYTIRASVVVL